MVFLILYNYPKRMLKQKIKKLISWEKNKKVNKLKNKLGGLIRQIVFKYKMEYNKYPFYIEDIKNIKDDNISLLNSFYDEYSEEIEYIILELFIDELETNTELFLKENWKYPLFSELNIDLKNTFEKTLLLSENWYKLLLTDYIISKIKKSPKSNHMRTLFKEVFLKNEKLFTKFIFINLDNTKKYKEFEDIWKEIKSILEDTEDQLLRHMEWGIHADKSSNVSDKFKNYIKTVFPLYANIWVTTKKLSKKEMEEYIKKMHNKK